MEPVQWGVPPDPGGSTLPRIVLAARAYVGSFSGEYLPVFYTRVGKGRVRSFSLPALGLPPSARKVLKSVQWLAPRPVTNGSRWQFGSWLPQSRLVLLPRVFFRFSWGFLAHRPAPTRTRYPPTVSCSPTLCTATMLNMLTYTMHSNDVEHATSNHVPLCTSMGRSRPSLP